MLAAFLLVACEKPDASDTTSPSVRAMVGQTRGNVVIAPPESPPANAKGPDGWDFTLENARFSKLENGQASIQIVTQAQTRPGPGLEVWLSGPDGAVFRWSGGSARAYDGVACFQVRLEDEASALHLDPEKVYSLTIAFRDPGDQHVVFAQTERVAGRAPSLSKGAPGGASTVARDLLGCPRSVI